MGEIISQIEKLSRETPLHEHPTLAQVERAYTARVIAAAGGNMSLAARVLGIDRRTLYRTVQRWGWDEARLAQVRGSAEPHA